MTQLSPHFSLAEMTHTNTGIPNTPGPIAQARLAHTAGMMEHVRALLGHPIAVASGYRSPMLNSAIGGSPTSDHMNGDACDFTCPDFGTPLEVADAVAKSGLKYDQLILEYGWVHLSWGPRMRQMQLTKKSSTAPFLHGICA